MSESSLSNRRVATTATGGSLRVPDHTLELLRDLVRAQTGLHYDDSRLHFLRDRLVPETTAPDAPLRF